MTDKIKGGFVIKARCIYESEVSHRPPVVREIWEWLYSHANHKPKKVGKYLIGRGQLLLNYREIQDGLSWKVGYRTERYSMDSTKKAMKVLREATMINTTKTPRGVIVTILNYEKYQDISNYEGTTRNPAIDPTSDTNAAPQDVTTNEKERKKERIIMGENPQPPDKPKPKKSKKFIPPTIEEIAAYCSGRNNGIDPVKFFNHYEANGWMRGKNKIKNWKACVITWEGNQRGQSQRFQSTGNPVTDQNLRAGAAFLSES